MHLFSYYRGVIDAPPNRRRARDCSSTQTRQLASSGGNYTHASSAPAIAGAVKVALSGNAGAANFYIRARVQTKYAAAQALIYSRWYSKDMLGKIVSISALIAAFLLLILFMTTTPATIGPLGILIIYILMYVSALGVLTFLLYGAGKLARRLSRVVAARRPIESMSLRRSYYFSSVLAIVPVILIGMQSVGEIGIYEVGLIIIFVIIACIYLAKRSV